MSVRSSVHSSLNGGSTKTKLPKKKEIEQDRKHKNNPSELNKILTSGTTGSLLKAVKYGPSIWPQFGSKWGVSPWSG